MPQAEWSKLHTNAIEEMLRIADETEDYVYDVMVPMMYDLGTPEQRLAFYNGVDMQALAQNNPKLYARYSKDALGLQHRDNQQKLDALDQLKAEQEKAWSKFAPQVQPQEVLGMTARKSAQIGLDTLPGQQGFGMDTAVPMGRFATGGG